jgi:hypothetical protein
MFKKKNSVEIVGWVFIACNHIQLVAPPLFIFFPFVVGLILGQLISQTEVGECNWMAITFYSQKKGEKCIWVIWWIDLWNCEAMSDYIARVYIFLFKVNVLEVKYQIRHTTLEYHVLNYIYIRACNKPGSEHGSSSSKSGPHTQIDIIFNYSTWGTCTLGDKVYIYTHIYEKDSTYVTSRLE